MNGRLFLEVARMAVEDPNEEWLRTAAGRAYYALFLESRDALTHWGVAVATFQAHSYVRTRFRYAVNADAKRVGEALDDLFDLRSHADYENARPFVSAFQVELAIDQAGDAIQLLDDITADAARLAAVLAAVRAVP